MNCNNKFENYTSLILDRWIAVCPPLSICPSVQPCSQVSRWTMAEPLYKDFSNFWHKDLSSWLARVKWQSQIFEKLLFFHKWLKCDKTGWKNAVKLGGGDLKHPWVTWNSLKKVLIRVKKIIRNFLFPCSKSPKGVPSHPRWRCSKWQVFWPDCS